MDGKIIFVAIRELSKKKIKFQLLKSKLPIFSTQKKKKKNQNYANLENILHFSLISSYSTSHKVWKMIHFDIQFGSS